MHRTGRAFGLFGEVLPREVLLREIRPGLGLTLTLGQGQSMGA